MASLKNTPWLLLLLGLYLLGFDTIRGDIMIDRVQVWSPYRLFNFTLPKWPKIDFVSIAEGSCQNYYIFSTSTSFNYPHVWVNPKPSRSNFGAKAISKRRAPRLGRKKGDRSQNWPTPCSTKGKESERLEKRIPGSFISSPFASSYSCSSCNFCILLWLNWVSFMCF